MTTEVKINSIFFDKTTDNEIETNRYRYTFSDENWVPQHMPNIEIIDTSRKTIIVVDPLVLTNNNNRIELQGAIINLKTGRITLPAPNCLLKMTLNLTDIGKNKSGGVTTYQIERMNPYQH